MQTEKTIKILMLEDNPSDAFLTERTLKKDNMVFVSERVDTREEFNEAIRRFEPDVILSDHGLPQFNSREALKICQKERASAPFILVTGTMSDENAIACLRDGADDYILKGNLTRLPSAIRRAIKERRLEGLKREARHALRKRNEELTKLNSELDHFVYSVSHNLRGPLASVMGLLNVAKMEQDRNSVNHLHEMMSTSISKLDETLKEILDYSRNARTDQNLGEIDWQASVAGSLTKLHYLKNAHRIKVHIDEDDSNVPLVSDGSRLGIIFNSILSNCIIYAHPERAASVEIQVKVTPEEASIEVTDNGLGIAPNYLPRVFEMFYRGSELSMGAGLGLYIAKETARRLGGKIEIESKEHFFTTVKVVLPNLRGEGEM